MKKISYAATALLCVALATMITVGLTACSNTSNTSSDAASSDTSVTSNVTAGTTDKENSNTYQVLKNCWVGDEITFTDYRFAVDQGVSMYYIEGRYVYTVDNKVVQLREEIPVADVGTSIGDIIGADTRFDKAKTAPAFYGSDGTYVTGSWDNTVTATTPNCVVEYVDWTDENETLGIVQSYLFTYTKVPVKVSGFYEPQSETPVDGDTTSTGEAADAGETTENGENSEAAENGENSNGENSEAAENGENSNGENSDAAIDTSAAE